MTLLILGLVIFFLPHVATMARGARAGMIQRFGEGPYKGAYSAVSLLGLILIVWGFALYRSSEYTPLYEPPTSAGISGRCCCFSRSS